MSELQEAITRLRDELSEILTRPSIDPRFMLTNTRDALSEILADDAKRDGR